MTPLDRAHAAILGDADDTGRRLYYAALAAAELFVALEAEAGEGSLSPLVLDTSDGPFVPAFDSEARLGDFLPAGCAYAAMPGCEVIALLGANALGLAVNPEVAPSATLLPPAVLDWITGRAGQGRVREVAIARVLPAGEPPDSLGRALEGLAGRLVGAAGAVCLARAELAGGGNGPVVAMLRAPPPHRDACRAAVAELAGLLGCDGGIAIAFPAEGLEGALGTHGQVAQVPVPERRTPRDADAPPRLI